MIAMQNVEELRSPSQNGDPIERLRRAYPWPATRPVVMGPVQNPGWLGEGTDGALAAALSDRTRVVVELGAWLGMSTRYILDRAPGATVISVNHWEGSPEHRVGTLYQSMLPTLYETFLSQCWDYRDRLIPLRMTTLEGLQVVAQAGIQPDLIYIDAEHSYRAVTAELELASELFPHARLVGDDFDWRGVREAAEAFARRHARRVERNGARGWTIADPGEPSVAAETMRRRSRYVVLVPHLGGIEFEPARTACANSSSPASA